MPTSNKNIIIGITASIAAYKACDLISVLKHKNYNVKGVLTPDACNFITPLTIQSLTQNPVYTDMFKPISEFNCQHIELSNWADLVVIAPATADIISKISYGFADNLLAALVLSLPKKTKVLIAPAMNTNMWENEIMQKNIASLKKIPLPVRQAGGKYIFIEPRISRLACGTVGKGAMADADLILSTIIKHA
ncbi:MAG: flavoprotein [Candidatus Omnitrophota bacterium]